MDALGKHMKAVPMLESYRADFRHAERSFFYSAVAVVSTTQGSESESFQGHPGPSRHSSPALTMRTGRSMDVPWCGPQSCDYLCDCCRNIPRVYPMRDAARSKKHFVAGPARQSLRWSGSGSGLKVIFEGIGIYMSDKDERSSMAQDGGGTV